MHLPGKPLRTQLILAFALLSLTLGSGPAAQAQKLSGSPAQPAYDGPRFPGGPDSLRAVVGRAVRQASPVLAGQLFLRLELSKQGVPTKAYYLPPATPPALALARTKEAQDFAPQLVRQLPAFQLDASAADPASPLPASLVIPLTFGPEPRPTPLLYSEENPVFPLPAYTGPRRAQQWAYLSSYLGRQIRYPAEALRNQSQGTVYAYFEVSETGAVEQRRIAGSVSPSLDAEVLRVLELLPNASVPPRQGGQPVRVAYILPLNFKIQ